MCNAALRFVLAWKANDALARLDGCTLLMDLRCRVTLTFDGLLIVLLRLLERKQCTRILCAPAWIVCRFLHFRLDLRSTLCAVWEQGGQSKKQLGHFPCGTIATKSLGFARGWNAEGSCPFVEVVVGFLSRAIKSAETNTSTSWKVQRTVQR